MKHAALFDLDGVIIDSEKNYTRFWDEIESIYPTGIENYAYAIKGTTLETIMTHYPDEKVAADIIARLHRLQDTMVFEPYEGALDFLRALSSEGVPMALVTSSDDRKMKSLFRQIPEIPELFSVIIDASMVTRSKPDPQGYNMAADRLGVDPADCCVFEDSVQGLKAGRSAGGKVVGVATTYQRSIVEPLADTTVNTLAEMTIERFLGIFEEQKS